MPCSLTEVTASFPSRTFVCTFLESPFVIWRKSWVQEVLLLIAMLGVACETPRCFWPVVSIPLGPSAYCPLREGLTLKCGLRNILGSVHCVHPTLIATIPKDSWSWKFWISVTWEVHAGWCALSVEWRIGQFCSLLGLKFGSFWASFSTSWVLLNK